MIELQNAVPLAPLTTLRLGGPAMRFVTVTDARQLAEACLSVWADDAPWMALGGGSNVVVSDDGFEGTVIHIDSRGIDQLEPGPGDAPGTVRVRAQAGEPWDALVEYAVANGLSGIEALSGIPGSCGASPVQNIGAYGQEIASVLVGVEFLDSETGELQWLTAAELDFGYRTSALKRGRDGVVVSIDLRLVRAGTDQRALGQPIEYSQLADALRVELGDRVALAAVREAVLRVRGSKGMVLNDADPDSVSAGSFFTNPIVGESFARTLPSDAPRWVTEEPATPDAPETYSVKLSAAWLIEHAGLGRGFSLPGSHAAISGKHTLALVNRGGATASQVAELARFIQWRVMSEFGVNLAPEPVFVGFGSDED
ncbi:UDP-N-acetylmuramate dehydrogenase [Subtercola boreus]|uniref:UDP-N-acetylenolpyruvoylglucosamine reductase n=1 Tax=Subtercola boreus TaxID=120213 RepID=A0A3E0W8K4_9MICO|nr:UDP-N-acetylmuramate dehydrogenase [Subtercola boreus]RFA18784.1 UDP-N-acetylenolpyruvoylglucosamine reductase [Subtercola boreus]RFA18900.1 UDP-N-acetylenolpyruvoylglucosamine reductase [Subtercola boreus]RFA25436.1 UDP-N-acetylenolpyruvoylglucosamine reductase [Subtercola boreus]